MWTQVNMCEQWIYNRIEFILNVLTSLINTKALVFEIGSIECHLIQKYKPHTHKNRVRNYVELFCFSLSHEFLKPRLLTGLIVWLTPYYFCCCCWFDHVNYHHYIIITIIIRIEKTTTTTTKDFRAMIASFF